MLYPVYLHVGDEKHAHGITIPDFPGCFSAADSWEALPHAIQEAAELYFEGEDMAIPPPTPIEKLAHDPAYEDGVWMLTDIDLAKLHPASEGEWQQEVAEAGEVYASNESGDADVNKVEVILPKDLLKVIDEYAGKHQLNRSAVLARAAMMFLTTDLSQAGCG